MKEWMDERTNIRTDERKNELMNIWYDKWPHEGMSERTAVRIKLWSEWMYVGLKSFFRVHNLILDN